MTPFAADRDRTRLHGLPRAAPAAVRDLRGGVRLAVDGVQHLLDRAEGMHRRLATVSPPPPGRLFRADAQSLATLVYRGMRGAAGVLGGGLDLALASLQASLPSTPREEAAPPPLPMRDAAVAVLNGLAGDHLHRTGNPLAIEMALLRGGPDRPRLLVLAHDLCLSEQSWRQREHDMGQALAAALGCTPVYLRYNSGRRVSTNGRALAAELSRLVAGWTVPLERIALLGHGMGGLVLRSAAHLATQGGMTWGGLLGHMVFLGTPHHGAMLSADGRWLHRGLGAGAIAPLVKLAGVRSEGIDDMEHGNVLDEDWSGAHPAPRDARAALPLPAGVACHAVAGAVGDAVSDGLVPVASALGRHAVATRELALAPQDRWIAQGVDHMGLLRDEGVFQKVRQWLAAPASV